MWIMLSVNLLARKKSCPALEEVTVDRLEEIDQIVLTRRICLGLVMSLYDPLGLISLWTFRLKKLIREQSTPSTGGGWDAPLEDRVLTCWRKILKSLCRALGPRISAVYFLGDSKTVLQAMVGGSQPVNEYFGNRLIEVGDITTQNLP